MATLYINWEGATSSEDGSGEAAVFVKYTDGSTGEVAYMGGVMPSGWLVSRLGYRTFIDNNEAWTATKPVSGFLLGFRNSDSEKGCTLRNWRFFESTTASPTGSGYISDATTSSITYTSSITGAATDTGRRSQVIYLESWPHAAEEDQVVSIPASAVYSDAIVFTGLNAGCYGGPVAIYDGYGNKGYLDGVDYAMTDIGVDITTDMTTGVDGYSRVSLDILFADTCSQCPSAGAFTQHYYYVSSSIDGGSTYTCEATGSYGVVSLGDLLCSFPDSDSNQLAGIMWAPEQLFKVGMQLSRYYPDLLYGLGDSAVPGEVYANVEYLYAGTDSSDPQITSILARAWGRDIYVVASGYSLSGLDAIIFYQGSYSDPVETYAPFATSFLDGDIEAECSQHYSTSATGVYGVCARAVSDSGSESALSRVVRVAVDSTDEISLPVDYDDPTITAQIIDNSYVAIAWSGLDAFMPRTYGVPNSIVNIVIKRRSPGEAGYTVIATLGAEATSYMDYALTVVGMYDYIIEFIDYRDLVSTAAIQAYLSQVLPISHVPFLERYMGMIPKWTAATSKRLAGGTP
jgi:hypothetical protein